MSHSSIVFSDHKPVSATFRLTVPVKNEEKFRQVQRDVIAEVDKNENELLPQISLSTQLGVTILVENLFSFSNTHPY